MRAKNSRSPSQDLSQTNTELNGDLKASNHHPRKNQRSPSFNKEASEPVMAEQMRPHSYRHSVLSPIQESKSSSMIAPSVDIQVSQRESHQRDMTRDKQLNPQLLSAYDQQQHPFPNPENGENQAPHRKSVRARGSFQSSQKNASHTGRNEIQMLKQKIEYLFVYYCDYSLDKGQIFIKQGNLVKLLKDANILAPETRDFLNQKSVLLLISQETNNPQQQSIDFLSFLNILAKVSMIIYSPYPEEANPRQALEALIEYHVLPLLLQIENQIIENLNSNKAQTSSITESGQYIANVSIDSLRSIKSSEEDIMILSSVKHVLRVMYDQYFSPVKRQNEHVMKRLFKFLKDLEVCPYLVNQKTCFMIYYFSTHKEAEPSDETNFELSIAARLGQAQSQSRKTLRQKKQESLEHPGFSFDQFLTIVFKIAVVFYDVNISEVETHSYKKLLSLLARIELTKGFISIVGSLRQTKSVQTSFSLTPPKNVLVQLYLNQQQFHSQEELEYIRDVVLAEMDVFQICKILTDVDQHEMMTEFEARQKQEEGQALEHSQCQMEMYLEQVDDQLLKLFQTYCSFGDPLNTDRLKSSKFQKMLSEAGLVSRATTSPLISHTNQADVSKHLAQVSHRSSKKHKHSALSQPFAQEDNKISRNELDLIFTKVAAQKPKEQNEMKSKISIMSRRSSSMIRGISAKREPSQTLDLNFISYQQFKIAVFEAAKAIYQGQDPYLGCVTLIEDRILPLINIQSDQRSIQNQKIQEMIQELENDQVIDLLSDLHQAIYKVYDRYADHRGHMNFQQFMKFCTDFTVFPDIINKGDSFRVFMNLAFSSEEPTKFQESQICSRINITQMKSQELSSTMGMAQPSTKQVQLFDQHLFIEALALCALHIEPHPNIFVLGQEQESFEKIFMLIEKIASAEGLMRRRGSQLERNIRDTNLDKLDILALFRKKYKWYFEKKNQDLMLSHTKNDVLKQMLVMEQLRAGQTPYSQQTALGAPKGQFSKTQQKADLFSLILSEDYQK